MNTKTVQKKMPKRGQNKRLLAAWVDKGLYDAVKNLAEKKGHGNSSVIIVEALTNYVNEYLKS
jgi:hypothetical protein